MDHPRTSRPFWSATRHRRRRLIRSSTRADLAISLIWLRGTQSTRRIGRCAATWLGCIEPQYLDPDPVAIRRSPLAWLQAGCDGLVILSGDPADAYRLLSGCCAITAENRQHAAELRKLVRRPGPLPRITIAAGTVHHAA